MRRREPAPATSVTQRADVWRRVRSGEGCRERTVSDDHHIVKVVWSAVEVVLTLCCTHRESRECCAGTVGRVVMRNWKVSGSEGATG